MVVTGDHLNLNNGNTGGTIYDQLTIQKYARIGKYRINTGILKSKQSMIGLIEYLYTANGFLINTSKFQPNIHTSTGNYSVEVVGARDDTKYLYTQYYLPSDLPDILNKVGELHGLGRVV